MDKENKKKTFIYLCQTKKTEDIDKRTNVVVWSLLFVCIHGYRNEGATIFCKLFSLMKQNKFFIKNLNFFLWYPKPKCLKQLATLSRLFERYKLKITDLDGDKDIHTTIETDRQTDI